MTKLPKPRFDLFDDSSSITGPGPRQILIFGNLKKKKKILSLNRN
jgi:hypothetical protein